MLLGNFSIVDFFLASPAMIVLLICSIITVGYAIERLVYFRSTRINAKRFMQELRTRMRSRSLDSAVELCRGKRAALARVMEQALTHLHLGSTHLRDRIATAIEVEQVEMERNLGVLGTMSNIAPLLGLFGTVIGIIRAFADIARTGSGGSSVVAMGVSEALITTAAGIVIAVIATVFFNAFVRMIRTRIVEMEDARAELMATLQEIEDAEESAAGQEAGRYEYEQPLAAVAGDPHGAVAAEAPQHVLREATVSVAPRTAKPSAMPSSGQPTAMPGAARRPGGAAAPQRQSGTRVARVIDLGSHQQPGRNAR